MIMKYIILLLLVLHVESFASKAYDAFQNKEYQKAYTLYLEDAKKGDVKASYALSYLYFNGLGIEKNIEKALTALTNSALEGYNVAQYNLAMMYLDGRNVDKNITQALSWLKQAAQNDSSEAQYNLALMYYNAENVDENVTQAIIYLEEAANNGHPQAKANVGRILMKTLKFDKAIIYLKENVKESDFEAAYLLAEIYVEKGYFSEAKKWATIAIKANIVGAQELYDTYSLKKY